MKSVWIGWGMLASFLMIAGPAAADGPSDRYYRGDRGYRGDRIQPYGERRSVPSRPGYRRDGYRDRHGDRHRHDGRGWKRRPKRRCDSPEWTPTNRRNPRGGIDPPRPIDPPRRIEDRRRPVRRDEEPSRPLRFYKGGRSGGDDR